MSRLVGRVFRANVITPDAGNFLFAFAGLHTRRYAHRSCNEANQSACRNDATLSLHVSGTEARNGNFTANNKALAGNIEVRESHGASGDYTVLQTREAEHPDLFFAMPDPCFNPIRRFFLCLGAVHIFLGQRQASQ